MGSWSLRQHLVLADCSTPLKRRLGIRSHRWLIVTWARDNESWCVRWTEMAAIPSCSLWVGASSHVSAQPFNECTEHPLWLSLSNVCSLPRCCCSCCVSADANQLVPIDQRMIQTGSITKREETLYEDVPTEEDKSDSGVASYGTLGHLPPQLPTI